jgi:hypothetical protein
MAAFNLSTFARLPARLINVWGEVHPKQIFEQRHITLFCKLTSALMTVSGKARSTLAGIGSNFVETHGILMTQVGPCIAFIDVKTTEVILQSILGVKLLKSVERGHFELPMEMTCPLI